MKRPIWMYREDWGGELGRDFRRAREALPVICEVVPEAELRRRLWTADTDGIEEPTCCALCAIQWMSSVLKLVDEPCVGVSRKTGEVN